ncbi:MAG: GNAT family N-acetyltransferase [Clostridia bacterium]|nr:GNAT family N-acetyltransferase [Clostridia bacterium]
MLIRKMEKSDTADVISLIYESVNSTCSKDYSPEQLDAWVPKHFNEKKFSESLYGCFNRVMICDGVISGFISVSSDGYINRLYTHSKYQNMGIASRLLEEAEKWALSMGLDSFYLDASITARKFYINRGFKDYGESLLKRGDVVINAVLMKKVL